MHDMQSSLSRFPDHPSRSKLRGIHFKINGIEAAVVRPEKSRYPAELIEIIASVKLRALGLEDGDPF